MNVFYREHAIADPNNSGKTCGGPKAVTSTTTIKKRGVKIAREAGTLHPENPSGVSSPTHQ